MNYWTFQRKEIVDRLKKEGILIPNFSVGKIRGSDINAYSYILSKYNQSYGTNSKGLVFGLIGSSKYPRVENVSQLYKMLDEAGRPGGSVFPPETHKLLHLVIPDIVPLMPIDFYKFSDLMYFMDEDNKYDSDDIEEDIRISQENLFSPNLSDGRWELTVGHLPHIKVEWILEELTPREMPELLRH